MTATHLHLVDPPPTAAPATEAALAARRAGPSGTALLRVTLALCATAIVVRGVIAPEPGTSAGDHLTSVLVPIGVAAMIVWGHPRLRPAARGWLAVACGALALTAGIAIGTRHALLDRATAADVVDMLAAVAGLLLVGTALAALWRERRRDGPLARRIVRRAATGAGVLLAAAFVVAPIAFAIVGTHRVRIPIAAADLGRPARDVALVTSDGLRLSGWYVPPRNGVAIIVFPGRRAAPVGHARVLVRHGYGVLLVDPRGDGRSEGAYDAWGWSGEPDVAAAVAFLRRRTEVRRIGGLGLSVGGELLLQAAAHEPALAAIVSEGAGARSLAEQLDMPGIAAWRRPLSPWLVQTAAVRVLADAAPPPSLTDLVPRIAPRSVLLVSARDGHEDEALNRVYAAAARPPAERWELPRGGHTGALAAAPSAYERRVVGFFDRVLLRR